nr:acyl-CoA dehydrogenase family protein [Dietzia sp. CQ4]
MLSWSEVNSTQLDGVGSPVPRPRRGLLVTQQTRTARPEADPSIILATPERDELRTIVAQFVARHGTHEAVRRSTESDTGYSEARWRTLNEELQVAALAVPEDLGGHGFGFADLGVVLEETGAALLPEPVLASAVVAAQALVRADDPETVSDLLGAVMEGRRTIGVSLDGRVTLSADAVATGGAGPVVNGIVEGVLWGQGVDSLVVEASSGARTVLVVVDLADAERRDREVIDLTRRRADVHLVDAPARVLVGAARFADVVRELDLITRAALAAEHAGIAARLLDDTVAYVGQRHQFGRPIGSFQAIKHRLADMLVDRERARSAAMYG